MLLSYSCIEWYRMAIKPIPIPIIINPIGEWHNDMIIRILYRLKRFWQYINLKIYRLDGFQMAVVAYVNLFQIPMITSKPKGVISFVRNCRPAFC